MAKQLPFGIDAMREMSISAQSEIMRTIGSLPASPEREEMLEACARLQRLWRAASDNFILDFFLAACWPELEDDMVPLGITRDDFLALRSPA